MIKSLNIGRALYNVEGLVIGSLNPYMLSKSVPVLLLDRNPADINTDPTAWNWAGKTAFFWAGFDVLCIIWIYFRLPDPTGMTFAEIDKVNITQNYSISYLGLLLTLRQRFELKISARNFRSVVVDEFESERKQLKEAKVVTVEDVDGGTPTVE